MEEVNPLSKFGRLILVLLLMMPAVAWAQPSQNWVEDVSDQVLPDSTSGYQMFPADLDNDGYPDLVTVEVDTTTQNSPYQNGKISILMNRMDPNGSDSTDRIFIDRTDSSEVRHNPATDSSDYRAMACALGDFNNDGYTDMISGVYYHRSGSYNDNGSRMTVFLNDGEGHLMRETEITDFNLPQSNQDFDGLINNSGLSLLDYNRDGNLDVFMTEWWHTLYQQNGNTFASHISDYLFRGNGDGTFTNVTQSSGIRGIYDSVKNSLNQPFNPSYGANVVDLNQDGWPDILVSPYCRSRGQALINNGDGTFDERAQQIGYNAQAMGGDNGQDLCQWGAHPADIDHDGDFDILHTLVHGGSQPGEGRTTWAINDNGQLSWDMDRMPIDFSQPVPSHRGDNDAMYIDLENNGLLDVFIAQTEYANNARNHYYRHMPDHTFEDVSDQLGVYPLSGDDESRVVTVLDYDRDGDDDLFVTKHDSDFTGNGNLVWHDIAVLENKIGQDNNYIQVKLDPPANVNQSAIGAHVRVYSSNQDSSFMQLQEIKAGMGHMGNQKPFIYTFGLGNRTIDSITVDWPDPADTLLTVVEQPSANRTITISEDTISTDRHRPLASREKRQWRLYPNPVGQKLTLYAPHGAAGHLRSLKIMDPAGRVVETQHDVRHQGLLELGVGELSKGLYLVKLQGENGTYTRRFMKQ
jgi:hypothetical protein